MTRTAGTVLVITALLAAGCQSSTRAPAPGEETVAAVTGIETSETPDLYPGFGNYHRPVTTTSAEAQQWFDQGIQLLYGFNHDEAIRSFARAAAIDPDCAMAWWGIAYANGLHINNPEMTEKQSKAGHDASREALARINDETPVEQALIDAVVTRYEWPAPGDRAGLDQAYAAAMERAWQAHPHDPDVGALYAESLMNLQPWDMWTKEGLPKGRTDEIVLVLEQAIALDQDHPGANHFYIHAVEASPTPERALAAAATLEDLVPGSGHLTHMPSHIYIRVGRYADASDANERAIIADRRYFALAPEPEFYGLYFVHNVHFLAYAAMMEGRYLTAINAARELERDIPPAFLENYILFADGFMPTTRHVMIRFGKWADILTEPAPPEERLISRAAHHYARGVAYAASGRPAEARLELAAFDDVVAGVTDEWLVGTNTGPDVLAVARRMMEGEILFREGQYDEAFARLREGVTLEEGLVYDEPPGWMQPVRHALGALLMDAGRYDEAETVYREDLVLNPGNGWSLLGLEQSLRARGGANPRELDRLTDAREAVWRRSDVRPTSSCYCAQGRAGG